MTNHYTSKPQLKNLKPKPLTIQTILNFSKAFRAIDTKNLTIELIIN